jgi:hypothetical protein
MRLLVDLFLTTLIYEIKAQKHYSYGEKIESKLFRNNR